LNFLKLKKAVEITVIYVTKMEHVLNVPVIKIKFIPDLKMKIANVQEDTLEINQIVKYVLIRDVKLAIKPIAYRVGILLTNLSLQIVLVNRDTI
jgi:hypothetical protein